MLTELLSSNLPSQMHTDMRRIFAPSKEDALIAYAKAWASYYEIYNNSIVYPDAYSKLLKSIESRALE